MEEQFGLLTCEEAFLALVCLELRGSELYLNDEILGFNGKINLGLIAAPFHLDRPSKISVAVRSQLSGAILLRDVITGRGSYVIDLFNVHAPDLFDGCLCNSSSNELCVPVLVRQLIDIHGVAGVRLLVSSFIFPEPKLLEKVVTGNHQINFDFYSKLFDSIKYTR